MTITMTGKHRYIAPPLKAYVSEEILNSISLSIYIA